MLAKKLHLKPGMRVAVMDAPPGFALRAAGVVVEKSLVRDLDVVLTFARTDKELAARWPRLTASLKPDGALWVAYPKKSSGIESDLAGMREWNATKNTGWNPVSMIGIDDTWSSVRFKHAPELERQRAARPEENIADTDGTICVDRVARRVTAPSDLQNLLSKNARARTAFDALAFSHRKEYIVWILAAKKAETRAARVQKTIALLTAGKKNPTDK